MENQIGRQEFDPEDVSGIIGKCDFGDGLREYHVVLVSDYERLLDLYRARLAATPEPPEGRGNNGWLDALLGRKSSRRT